MNSSPIKDARLVLDHLSELGKSSSTKPQNIETARQWEAVIREALAFIEDRAHPVVFIGSVGVGKSSLINVLAKLLIGPLEDKSSLQKHAVLATGAGRTTLGEVRIRACRDDDKGTVGLIIDEPFSLQEMKQEIEFYARDEWMRRQPDVRHAVEDDAEPAQEIRRAIREMTGYTEYQETYLEDGRERRRLVRPLDTVIPQFNDHVAFAKHLLERARLSARTEPYTWWCDASNPEPLKELKQRFEAVNRGSEPTAMLPRSMTVVVPDPVPGSGAALNLTLIDTRGLDGRIEPRRDLQELLRDPRAVPVLCTPFKDAPGPIVRALLLSMDGDAELRQAIPHALVVVLDHGEADQVNGAGGDRDFGQEIKIDECHIALENARLQQRVEKTQIIAFNVLQDDRGKLLSALDSCLARLRRSREEALRQHVADARSFLDSADNEAQQEHRASIDRQIRDTMVQHPLSGAPLSDPLQGLYKAIEDCRYASVVYAACRRQGVYRDLDLYAAVAAEASRATAAWLDTLIRAVMDKLDELGELPDLQGVQDYIRLRRSQFDDGQRKVSRDYAQQVGEQVAEFLKPDPVWRECCDEWGQGAGFKRRVLSRLENWSHWQPKLTAHERTNAAAEIPLFADVAWPVQSIRFTIHVRNLRALRQVSWTPEPVSVLIGANGAGKTTLLLALKLLRDAYERGLPDAVITVLGGSSNLRSWDAPEDEPVELGLDIGDVSWRITLSPREGAVDYQTNERLTDGSREIFSRDALGTFLYGGERLANPGWKTTGLRALMERGATEPAVQRVASLLRSIAVYHDPDLWNLRAQGSNTAEDRHLHSRGTNALTMLRRWHQERGNRHRYQFVIDGLVAAFPGVVSDLDFVEAGTTLAARIYRPGTEMPGPLASEANGVLQFLVLMCDVAAAEDGGVVAIDEPENSLHPYALRRFLEWAGWWTRQHDVTVLLATQSTVLLDELNAHPEQVYVMKPANGEPAPTRLDDLCNREWLATFKLGDLYEQDEIGSNVDKARAWRASSSS
jgi:predicted ATPase